MKPLPHPESDYLRGQAEAARYARVSPRCISDWQSKRIIPFLKISAKCVLFRKSDIDRALGKFEVSAVGGFAAVDVIAALFAVALAVAAFAGRVP